MIVKELFARLGLDIDSAGFTAGDVAIAGIKLGLTTMAGVAERVGVELASMVQDLVKTTSTINDTSQAVGISTDALQEFGYGAKLNGSSLEEFSQSLIIFSRRLIDAKDGNKEAAKAFSDLHVKITDGHGKLKTTEDLLGDLADAFQKMPDGPKKTAAAVDLFGRSGARLIATLNGGKEGIAAFRKEAHDLGFVIDSETIKAGDDLGDNFDRLRAIALGLQGAIAGPLLSQLNNLVDQFKAWFLANKALIGQRMEQITKFLSAAIRGLVVVLKAMWLVLGTVIDFWQQLAVLLAAGVLTAITLNAAAILALGLGYLRAGAAAALAGARAAVAWVAAAAGPLAIAAIFAFIILLVDELITKQENGLTLLDILIPKWNKFIDDFIHGGKEDEPWLLTSLRGLARLVFDFPGVWAMMVRGIKNTLTEFSAWLSDWAVSVGKTVASPITGLTKFLDRNVFSHISGGSGFSGGASSPGASVAASPGSGRTTVIQQSNAIPINVYQQPGQSSTELAGEIDRAISSRQSTLLEETLQSTGG